MNNLRSWIKVDVYLFSCLCGGFRHCTGEDLERAQGEWKRDHGVGDYEDEHGWDFQVIYVTMAAFRHDQESLDFARDYVALHDGTLLPNEYAKRWGAPL